jgi:hypothetical protein
LITNALRVSPRDYLEFDIIVVMGLEFAIRMLGIAHGIPIPKRQAKDTINRRIGIGQFTGEFIQMRKAEELHSIGPFVGMSRGS